MTIPPWIWLRRTARESPHHPPRARPPGRGRAQRATPDDPADPLHDPERVSLPVDPQAVDLVDSVGILAGGSGSVVVRDGGPGISASMDLAFPASSSPCSRAEMK